MHVSSQTEARQGIFAILVAVPFTLAALGGTIAFTGFVV